MNNYLTNLSLIIIIFLSSLHLSAKDNKNISHIGNQRLILLNTNWEYLEDPIDDIKDLTKSKKIWIDVNLPHSWNKFDAVDHIPGYRRSASWYRKTIFIPKSLKNSRIIIYFEGVNIVSKIFVNNKFVGEHIGGYLGFEFDITPFIKYNNSNTIHVRADNSINPDIIPSQKSDFFIYGGINRNVWLKIVPNIYIKSVKVHTYDVSNEKAKTSINIYITNSTENTTSITLKTFLQNPKGIIVTEQETKQKINPGINNISVDLPSIFNPELWSPKSPNLYTAKFILEKDKKFSDSLIQKFGYRYFEFKERGPFYLNGERLLLRGTQRHEDHAGLANAIPDSLHRRDMEMIKEMGANFVRLAHYPQAPEVYRACDELGLLVWDELPWCRGGMGGIKWKENTRRMLHELIEQNYNHPSIIIWSLGNEVDWLPDFPGGDNSDSIRTFFELLQSDVRKMDPSRVTAVRKSPDAVGIVDVYSPSIWPGWYTSTYHNYEKMLLKARNDFKRFFHSEYGGDSHVGRHTENPVDGDGYIISDDWDSSKQKIRLKNISVSGDWGESYIVNLFDWYLQVSEQLDWFTGSAQWIFKDFGTPLRPENPIPYVNQKGLLDRSGKPKDAYYVFKSYWSDNPKFCYIESPTWTDRSGPKNLMRQIKVYSNCEEVELFLNGISQGRIKKDIKIFPASGLHWKVNFSEGKNIIRAVGYHENNRVAEDSNFVNYWFQKNLQSDNAELSSSDIELSYSKLLNGHILITAVVKDKNGNRFLDYNKRIYFTSEGSGSLLENYGTPTRSSVIEMANGKAQIEVQPAKDGTMVIEARTQDFKGSFLKLEWEEIKKLK